jgi:predicted nucleic acid-binding protein
MERRRLYVDSGLFGDLADHTYEGDEIKRRISTLGHDIKVPQVVVGEIISTTIGDNRKDKAAIYKKTQTIIDTILYLGDPKLCLPPINLELLQHIEHLTNKCRLDPTDAFILAQVLQDVDSEYFVTSDQKMLYNFEISEYESDLREDGKRKYRLVITADP